MAHFLDLSLHSVLLLNQEVIPNPLERTFSLILARRELDMGELQVNQKSYGLKRGMV